MSFQATVRRLTARPATLTQVKAPTLAGKAIRALTGSGGSRSSGSTGGAAERICGIDAANRAAGAPAAAPTGDLTRTTGIAAANLAAGVPTLPGR